jgi:hypothetical protein
VSTWLKSIHHLVLPSFSYAFINEHKDHRDMGHDKHDDLDRRLTDAWAKWGYKPDPSRREQTLRRASVLEAKRKAPQPLPPPQPLSPMTCCPACGSDKYHFELGIDSHVCENCGNMFF